MNTNRLFTILATAVVMLPGISHAKTISRCDGVWTVENSKLRVIISPSDGRIKVLDKVAHFTWQQPGLNTTKFHNIRKADGGRDGVTFNAYLGSTAGKPNDIVITVSVPASDAQVYMQADITDRNAKCDAFDFLEPFILDTAKSFIVACDYCGGHMYPTALDTYPIWSLDQYSANNLDMPWVGVCDIDSGLGYSVIADTSEDATFRCSKFGNRRAPWVRWEPQMGKFGYARKLIYSFTPNGGYVALAKAYRSYIQASGGLVTFTQKAQSIPNIRKLYGAPMVWDYYGRIDPKEMKASGVDHAIHHVSSWTDPNDVFPNGATDSAHLIETNNDLGYLTEEYDQYYDAYAFDSTHTIANTLYDIYPDHMAKEQDQSVRKGWIGEFGQMFRRCPSFYKAAAQNVIPTRLQAYHTSSRYMDVHTAMCVEECWDPNHTKTRTQWKQDNIEILDYVRNRELVVGGEHGRWWAVPKMDIFNGTMSCPGWPWPADHPKTYGQLQYGSTSLPADAWSKYELYGSLGHTYRVPLWELVFHGCTVSMWYPEDSSDWTVSMTGGGEWYQTKKDAMNVLYGTPAMFFTCKRDGSWFLNRKAFLTSYRNTCKPHEILADKEMTKHEFLTSNRNVQKTTWSDGTVNIVNFGASNYRARIGSRTYSLPQYGFLVKGSKLEAYCAIVGGKKTTCITMDGYRFTDKSGVGVTMRRVNATLVQVITDKPTARLSIRPFDVTPEFDLSKVKVFETNINGDRIKAISFTRVGSDQICMGPFAKPVTLDIVAQ